MRSTVVFAITLTLIAVVLVSCSSSDQQAIDQAVSSTLEAQRAIDKAVNATISAAPPTGTPPEPTLTPRPIPTSTSTSVPDPAALPTSVAIPSPSATPVPTPTSVPTPVPTPVPAPSPTPSPSPTSTPLPPTATSVPPTATSLPAATETPVPQSLTLADLVENVRRSVVKVSTDIAVGSGVIFQTDSSGNALILTNEHVIDGASSIEVIQEAATIFPATLNGHDSLRDLAVLNICCDKTLSALEFSGSVKLGETVVALGFPLGVDSLRISQGIVSGKQFSVKEDRFEIQTDAAINEGSSGGPLLLMDGTIAGINTYKVVSSETGTAVEGFGFAVASETLTSTVPSLVLGQLVAAPTVTASTATPHPNLVGKKYVDDSLGFEIVPPSGWAAESRDDGVLIFDQYSDTYIITTISSELSSDYRSTSDFVRDYTIGPNENWNDFQIQSELDLTRYSRDGTVELLGRQFNATFSTGSGDSVENFISTTHWFVISGWLYEAQLIAPLHGSKAEADKALSSFRPEAVHPSVTNAPTPAPT